MTRAELAALLDQELARVNAEIDAAYWLFTRCRRAKPPVLVVPWAYRLRRELVEKLRWLRRRTA